MEIDVNAAKRMILISLAELEEDCKILLERVDQYRRDLQNVQSEEDAIRFDSSHDIEAGLHRVRLF